MENRALSSAYVGRNDTLTLQHCLELASWFVELCSTLFIRRLKGEIKFALQIYRIIVRVW